MTVVSSKEFVANDDKYFDMAMTERVFVQRGNIVFIVTQVRKKRKKPNDDFRRTITMDEFNERARGVVEAAYKIYTNERDNFTGSR